jgi:hypothetical protein
MFLVIPANISQFFNRFNVSRIHVSKGNREARDSHSSTNEQPNNLPTVTVNFKTENHQPDNKAGHQSSQMSRPIDERNK